VTPPSATATVPAPPAADIEAEPTFAIADVVERTGVSHDTLRYYEKEGLLLPPRDEAGRRRYREIDVRRVVFLTRMRQSEMPIRDLKRYVALVEEGPATEAERLAIMEAHREAVLARRSELDAALSVIEFKIAAYGGACGA
jgi:DNA-binding transcriptional MerR regulator